MSRSTRCSLAAAALAFLLGALALTFWVATRNFAIADPVATPRTAEVLAMTQIEGDLSREMFSRYFASESNRALFAFMGPAQVVAALLAFALAFGAVKGRPRGTVVRALLGLVAVVAIGLAPLVPKMIESGRAIDFVPRVPVTPERADFMRWHGIYMAGNAALMIAALLLVALLLAAARAGDQAAAGARSAE
ncbi:MAG: hypothetical protein JNL90_18670 [Planctomycetes bacterium]|nr:hypothetical protein [Planctomycetota bacterium]